MMHEQLTISQLLDHAAENHGERQIAMLRRRATGSL